MKKDDPIDRLLQQASRPDAAPADVCLDAETLAAWTDGTLSHEARAAAETHAADCDRCLQVLAAIARTTPPPSEAATTSWFSVRWLLPLATAAVAITAWVLVQDPVAPPAAPMPAPAATQQIDRVTTAPPAERRRDQDTKATARTESVAKRAEERPAAGAAAARGAANEAAKPVAQEPATPTAAAAPPPAATSPVAQDRFMARAVLAPPPVVIVSPDPNVRWRVAGAAIERSTDGGTSWVPQPAIPVMEILGGSSPDPRVCWLVGRKGEAWVTADGTSWRRLEFPDRTVDLVAVSAQDARLATVTTRTGSTYRTEDGGKTWRLQEI